MFEKLYCHIQNVLLLTRIKMKRSLRKIWYYLKVLLVVLFIIIEELTWKRVGEPIYRRIKALRIMRKFKTWISNVKHRYALLTIFLSVFLLMEITSTIGLVLIGTGAIVTGILFYTMKIFLTVPAVVIFNAGKKPLLSFWLIRFIFILILLMKRSRIFRNSKKYFRKIKVFFVEFKSSYFKKDTENSFLISIRKIYKYIRR